MSEERPVPDSTGQQRAPLQKPVKTVLLIDDDQQVRYMFTRLLEKNGYRPIEASRGQEGLDAFSRARPEAVFLDLRMPGMDGMDVLRELKNRDATVPIILITAHGDIPAAVEAIKLGAYDFLTKPPDFDKLMTLLRRAVEAGELMRTVNQLNVDVAATIEHALGASAPIKAIAGHIHKVAHSDFSLMIQGETGSGKSYIARMIHDLSRRSAGPFVMVDVGSIPDTLLESELFGYEKGAFTGADKKKTGYFEQAAGGTLFIDELQNISPAMQGKLLAAVEERQIRLLGSTHPVNVDIRIICATNENLSALVRDGRVREDLFYRLGEFFITIPPLRERREDIRFFARRFMIEAAEDLQHRGAELSEEAAAVLLAHEWPGNIRELKNVVRRAVLLAEEGVILPVHLQFPAAGPAISGRQKQPGAAAACSDDLRLVDQERQAIIRAMNACDGVKSKAAAMLAIDYKTLLRKLKKYGISP